MPGADFLQLDPAGAPAHGLADWLTAALRARSPTAGCRSAPGCRRPAVLADRARRVPRRGRRGVPAAGRRGPGRRPARAAAPRCRAGHRAAASPRTGAAAGRPPPHGSRSTCPPGVPDLSAFPRAAWLRAERAALSAATRRPTSATATRAATPALRAALAGWLARTRGMRAEPGEVIVVNGVAQGLALLAQVLAARGTDTVGVEDPGSRGTRDQLSRWGMRPCSRSRWTSTGCDVAALAGPGWTRSCSPRPTSSRPAWCSPRSAAGRWSTGPAPAAWSIEDDYDAEHRYDRPPVAALQAHRPGPGRPLPAASPRRWRPRCGWAGCWRRAELRDELVERQALVDLASPALRPARAGRADHLAAGSSGTCGWCAPGSGSAATPCSTR